MSEIFLSYAREDLPRAQLISNCLETLGYSVFWDRRIYPGESFDEVIGHALSAARCVVVLWSVASVISHWVRDEANEGKNRHVLVPVLIDDVQPPLGFRSLQTANLIDWQGDSQDPEFQRIVKSVERLMGHSENDPIKVGKSSGSKALNIPKKNLQIHLLINFGIRILLSILLVLAISWGIYNFFVPGSSSSFMSLLTILLYIYNISFFIALLFGFTIYNFYKQVVYKIIILSNITSVISVGIYLTYHIIKNYSAKGLIYPIYNIILFTGVFLLISLVSYVFCYFIFRKYF